MPTLAALPTLRNDAKCGLDRLGGEVAEPLRVERVEDLVQLLVGEVDALPRHDREELLVARSRGKGGRGPELHPRERERERARGAPPRGSRADPSG